MYVDREEAMKNVTYMGEMAQFFINKSYVIYHQ
jgi:hypothetical protein